MITLSGDSPKSAYYQVYKLQVGGIFKIESDYETVMRRLNDFMPLWLSMEIVPITPGTTLFTIYGADHLVITKVDSTQMDVSFAQLTGEPYDNTPLKEALEARATKEELEEIIKNLDLTGYAKESWVRENTVPMVSVFYGGEDMDGTKSITRIDHTILERPTQPSSDVTKYRSHYIMELDGQHILAADVDGTFGESSRNLSVYINSPRGSIGNVDVDNGGRISWGAEGLALLSGIPEKRPKIKWMEGVQYFNRSEEIATLADITGVAKESWVSENYLSLTGGTVKGDTIIRGTVTVVEGGIIMSAPLKVTNTYITVQTSTGYGGSIGLWTNHARVTVEGTFNNTADGELYRSDYTSYKIECSKIDGTKFIPLSWYGGNIILGGKIKIDWVNSNVDLLHDREGKDYIIYDASNANLSTVDWRANKLTATTIEAAGVTLTGGATIGGSVLIAGSTKVAAGLIVTGDTILNDSLTVRERDLLREIDELKTLVEYYHPKEEDPIILGNHTFAVKLVLGDGVDPASVQLSFPKLKYDKKLIFSFITDDSYTINNFVFNGINKGRFIDDAQMSFFSSTDTRKFYGHWGWTYNGVSMTTGKYRVQALDHSDSLGGRRRFNSSIAVWSSKFTTRDAVNGIFNPYISALEVRNLQDFGHSVVFHDLSVLPTTQAEYDTQLDLDAAVIRSMTDRHPKIMAEPGGNKDYLTFGYNNNKIQMQLAQNNSTGHNVAKVYPHSDSFTLDKNTVTVLRQFNTGADAETAKSWVDSVITQLKNFGSSTDLTSIPWIIGSSHDTGSSPEVYLFEQLYANFGSGAADSIWIPTVDEFFEYWWMCKNAVITKEVVGKAVTFYVDIPEAENFWYKSMSLNFNDITQADKVSKVIVSDNIKGFKYGMYNGKLLMNVDYNEDLLAKVEKYVLFAEDNRTSLYAKPDAAYFVDMLRSDLQKPFLDRLSVLPDNTIPGAPILPVDPTDPDEPIVVGGKMIVFTLHEGGSGNTAVADTLTVTSSTYGEIVINKLALNQYEGYPNTTLKDVKSGESWATYIRKPSMLSTTDTESGRTRGAWGTTTTMNPTALSGNFGFMDDTYFMTHFYNQNSNNGNYTEVRLAVPAGNYNIKVYPSTADARYNTTAEQENNWVDVNGTISKYTFNTQFNVTNSVDVLNVAAVDGELVMKFINNNNSYTRPGFNVMLIEQV